MFDSMLSEDALIARGLRTIAKQGKRFARVGSRAVNILGCLIAR